MEKKYISYGVLGVLAIVLVSYIMTVFSYRDDCVAAEEGIKAQLPANKVSYDAMWKSFRESVQIQDIYVKGLKEVFDSAIKGRYGDNGVQATFQAIHEQNPNPSPEIAINIQRNITASRIRFAGDQTQLLDKKRQYGVILGNSRSRFVRFWFDFPTINMNEFNVITSDKTEEAFTTGRSDEIKLR